MRIEITDLPPNQKLSRITVDFDNGIPKTSIQTTEVEDATPIDTSFANAKLSVSQEVVEKPVIKDKKREIKVAETMQNLKI